MRACTGSPVTRPIPARYNRRTGCPLSLEPILRITLHQGSRYQNAVTPSDSKCNPLPPLHDGFVVQVRGYRLRDQP